MRARLSAAATKFGLLPADFNVKEYSGISFRKGSLTALAAKGFFINNTILIGAGCSGYPFARTGL
jgi:hypothetical protein